MMTKRSKDEESAIIILLSGQEIRCSRKGDNDYNATYRCSGCEKINRMRRLLEATQTEAKFSYNKGTTMELLENHIAGCVLANSQQITYKPIQFLAQLAPAEMDLVNRIAVCYYHLNKYLH